MACQGSGWVGFLSWARVSWVRNKPSRFRSIVTKFKYGVRGVLGFGEQTWSV